MTGSETQPDVQGSAADAPVAAGFKRTELGVIPEDWAECPLSDLAEVVMGQSPPGRSYNTAGLGKPLINGPTEFTSKHPIPIQWTTEPTKSCKKRDVLLCVRGSSTGRINVADADYCIGRGVAAIRSKVSESPAFLLHLVDHVIGRLLSRTTGSTFPNLDRIAIASVRVICPTAYERPLIGEALSDVDELIDALGNLIAKKKAIRQGAMQQLLTGRTQLPGFNGPWKTKRFGEIAKIRNEKKSPHAVAADTVCVELEHIGQGDGRLLNHTVASLTSSTKYSFEAEDVLFGRLRPYLRKYWHADRSGLCSTEIWPLIREPAEVISGYLYSIVQTDTFIGAATAAYGTHMPRADWSVIRGHEIRLPTSLKEQEVIAGVLADMDAEIAALQRGRGKTKAIKKGMMQALLTGRVRLINQETAT